MFPGIYFPVPSTLQMFSKYLMNDEQNCRFKIEKDRILLGGVLNELKSKLPPLQKMEVITHLYSPTIDNNMARVYKSDYVSIKIETEINKSVLNLVSTGSLS